jgi:uncharacterized protein
MTGLLRKGGSVAAVRTGRNLRSPLSIDGSISRHHFAPCGRIQMKYADASAVLRILFSEPGPSLPLSGNERVVSSKLVEIETYRAVDRERLTGTLDDTITAIKRKELADLLAMLDLASIDDKVIERAKSAFAINVRALDAVHVATAEVLAAESDGEPLEFWTHDERQAAAALSRGLTVSGLSREDRT